MTTVQDIKTQVLKLADESYQGFCQDLEAMLGVAMNCNVGWQKQMAADEMSKMLKKFCAVNTVTAKGIINGRFLLVLSQQALFALAGNFVMLPEKKIIDSCKFGTLTQAQEIADAVKETGNLLIGTWDRVFREGTDENTHLLQNDSFTDSWENLYPTLDLQKDAELTVCSYEFEIAGLPPFVCYAVFDEEIFSPQQELQTEQIAEDEVIEEQLQQQDKTNSEEELQQSQVVDDTQQSQAEEKPDVAEVQMNPITDLKAEDVMQSDVQWCKPDCTTEEAMQQMQNQNVDYLLVGDGKKAEGIITMADLNAAISIYLQPIFGKWKRPLDEATLRIKVNIVMGKPVRTVPLNMALEVAIEKIIRFGGCLVVTDNDGNVKGIITDKVLLKRLLR